MTSKWLLVVAFLGLIAVSFATELNSSDDEVEDSAENLKGDEMDKLHGKIVGLNDRIASLRRNIDYLHTRIMDHREKYGTLSTQYTPYKPTLVHPVDENTHTMLKVILKLLKNQSGLQPHHCNVLATRLPSLEGLISNDKMEEVKANYKAKCAHLPLPSSGGNEKLEDKKRRCLRLKRLLADFERSVPRFILERLRRKYNRRCASEETMMSRITGSISEEPFLRIISQYKEGRAEVGADRIHSLFKRPGSLLGLPLSHRCPTPCGGCQTKTRCGYVHRGIDYHCSVGELVQVEQEVVAKVTEKIEAKKGFLQRLIEHLGEKFHKLKDKAKNLKDKAKKYKEKAKKHIGSVKEKYIEKRKKYANKAIQTAKKALEVRQKCKEKVKTELKKAKEIAKTAKEEIQEKAKDTVFKSADEAKEEMTEAEKKQEEAKKAYKALKKVATEQAEKIWGGAKAVFGSLFGGGKKEET